MITTVIRKARAHVAQRALDFAEEYKNDSVIYTMGSGACYGEAYSFAICLLNFREVFAMVEKLLGMVLHRRKKSN